MSKWCRFNQLLCIPRAFIDLPNELHNPSRVWNLILKIYETLCRSPACGFRMDSFPVNEEGDFQFDVHLEVHRDLN
ncbi:hypothetical protein CEXT_72121 [Caerostris extrusa]|uniref:Uncharacterized protein n=1 Tax=Caerostris extrusa TaxID=172846 RepID=A0AAV4VD30_CAEEX|nr:hypothetical protein CEXT_72121 [Caerostris extrusa]